MKRAFGNILYELRMEANFTQADLAERAGLSQAAVSRLEKGSGGQISKLLSASVRRLTLL